jgi:glycosyltransferase involved in cell wall biosynthesis
VLASLADLLTDPQRCRTMGEAAAARVASNFTWAGRTADLRKLLEALNKSGGGASPPGGC